MVAEAQILPSRGDEMCIASIIPVVAVAVGRRLTHETAPAPSVAFLHWVLHQVESQDYRLRPRAAIFGAVEQPQGNGDVTQQNRIYHQTRVRRSNTNKEPDALELKDLTIAVSRLKLVYQPGHDVEIQDGGSVVDADEEQFDFHENGHDGDRSIGYVAKSVPAAAPVPVSISASTSTDAAASSSRAALPAPVSASMPVLVPDLEKPKRRSRNLVRAMAVLTVELTIMGMTDLTQEETPRINHRSTNHRRTCYSFSFGAYPRPLKTATVMTAPTPTAVDLRIPICNIRAVENRDLVEYALKHGLIQHSITGIVAGVYMPVPNRPSITELNDMTNTNRDAAVDSDTSTNSSPVMNLLQQRLLPHIARWLFNDPMALAGNAACSTNTPLGAAAPGLRQ
ncbi:hypothetical protein DL769_002816 [Monosporascus sp. CRB-8-3]|nr:hypothetical protein DL769_002816 [Monosporascus sp. CRB-8-3]